LPAPGRIQFADRATGWATVSAWDPDRWNARSNEASILMTRDGGRTWARRFHAAGAQPHFDLSFVDLQHGWGLGGDWSNCSMGGFGGYSLYRTTDGGDHWETIQSPDAGWWGPTPEGASAAGFVGSLVFDDQRNGWLKAGTGAGPGGGGILVSHDGGDHWMRFNGDGGVWSVRSIGAIGRDRAWATLHVMTATGHEMAVVMTADGGRTWQRQLSWPWSY